MFGLSRMVKLLIASINRTPISESSYFLLSFFSSSCSPASCSSSSAFFLSPTEGNKKKSKIDLKPFANTIAETVYKVCSSSSSSAKDGGANNINEHGERITVRSLLKELLRERLQNIEKDPSLKDTDRWTQSTVFYRLRPKLLKVLGYNAEDIGKKRQYITSMIMQICEELATKREELGIFAADRAQLYFKGTWHDIGYDDLQRLMHMGTDLIIIEKEGVAEVLAPIADRRRIALLNTRGFLTDYANILSQLASEDGCNISIVSDFDVSGMYI